MSEINSKKVLYNQHMWNIIFLILSIIAFCVFVRFFGSNAADALTGMTVLQFVVLALATFRLTRLFVSDHIMQWLRDMFFVITEESNPETGTMMLVRTKPARGLRRLMADLLGCSWCVGVWMAFLVVVLYVAVVLDFFAIGRAILYIFAFAGAASFLQALTGFFVAPRAPDVSYTQSTTASGSGEGKQKTPPNVCTECGLG